MNEIKRRILCACIAIGIFLFVCFMVFAFLWMIPRKPREYTKSEEYFEESIEDITVNNVCFSFLQVNEVPDLEKSFYEKYDSYESVHVGSNINYPDIMDEYINMNIEEDQVQGMSYFQDHDGHPVGVLFSYISHEPNVAAHLYVSIDVCISDEPLEEYADLLPYMEQVDEGHIYSIYDNIFYYMEGEENMNMFDTDICTAVFDGSRYYYFFHSIGDQKESDINNYCSVLYELLTS